LYYSYSDSQGSLIALVHEGGSIIQRFAYDPWGARRDPNDWTAKDSRTSFIINRGYTGHEHLSVFGLINMNARLYDPALGRFLSPDPYVQTPDNSQNFNRYSYCLNNPLRYSDPTGMLTWNDIIGGISLVAGIVLEFIPGGQGLGTSLIVTGFSHFAYTIGQVQNSNGQIGWNEASNNAGINFGGSINFNGPTSKEKNHSKNSQSSGNTWNNSYSSDGVDASNSDHDINILADQLNHYNDAQNDLNITFGKGLDDISRGGVQINLEYFSKEDMSNAYFVQHITTDFPGDRKFSLLSVYNGSRTSYYDNSHSGPNSTWYYPPSEMKAHIFNGGYTVKFTDFPRRPLYYQASTYWYANLSLINKGHTVFDFNYGFRLDYSGIHPIYFNYYFYPQY